MCQTRSPSNGKGACKSACAQYRRRNSNMVDVLYYIVVSVYGYFMTKQETFSVLNHVNGQRAS